MTLRIAHILALYATLALPVLGLMSGSPFLLGAGVVYFLLLLVGIPHLHEVQRPLPRTVVVHALTVAGLVAALSIFRRAPIDAGLGIVMLGVLNRFLLRGGQRDDLILVGAAGVLLAAATVITPGFSFALLVVAFVPAALWAMLSASILGLAERSPVESRARLVKVYGARPVPRLGGTLTAWGLLLMVAGYAAVSFLPRYRFSGMLGAGGLVAFSGAGSSMTLTSGGVTGGGDGSVALLVDGPRGDLEGLYARLYVLDTLEDGTFRDGEGTVRHYPQGRAGNREGCRDVTLRRQVGRSRPHPVAVLGRQGPSAVSLSPRRKLLRYDSGSWAQRLSRSELDLRYHACIGQNVPAALPRSPTIRDALLTRYTQLPPDLDPRVRDLAQRISEGSTGPEDTTRRVLRHFGTGYAYSLDPLPGTEEDPLVRFLFEARRGHCELYAGAVAVLLRAAGVPARVATGYYGGWYNVRSRALEMGSDDAHAWVEVLIDGRWIWVDATPEDLRARRTHKRFAFVRDVWDALEALWYEYVIDFDDARRRALIDDLGSGLSGGFAGFADKGSEGEGPSGRGRLPLWVAAIPLALGLIGILGWTWRGRRGARLDRLGRRLQRLVGGRETQPLGRRLEELPDALRDEARAAVRLYERERFGPPGARPGLAAVVAAVDRLRIAVRRTPPPSSRA